MATVLPSPLVSKTHLGAVGVHRSGIFASCGVLFPFFELHVEQQHTWVTEIPLQTPGWFANQKAQINYEHKSELANESYFINTKSQMRIANFDF